MTERELLKVLGGNIRLYRGRNKWTQSELAEKIDISINFLSDIETGKKWASPITLVKLANIFCIEVYELLKPMDILPDNINSFIEMYTEDIFAAVSGIRNAYSIRLKKFR